jgi:hypothetical protein
MLQLHKILSKFAGLNHVVEALDFSDTYKKEVVVQCAPFQGHLYYFIFHDASDPNFSSSHACSLTTKERVKVFSDGSNFTLKKLSTCFQPAIKIGYDKNYLIGNQLLSNDFKNVNLRDVDQQTLIAMNK